MNKLFTIHQKSHHSQLQKTGSVPGSVLCHLAAISHWNFLCSNRNLGDAVTGNRAQWVCEPQGHAFLSLCVVFVVDEICPRLDPVKPVAKPGSSGPRLSFQTSLFSPVCSIMGRMLQPIGAAAGKALHCLGGVSRASSSI